MRDIIYAMELVLVRGKMANLAGSFARLGVTSLSVFGSAANGTERPDSDLDFLVEFDGPATFDRYMGLKELLEVELGKRIDLVTLRALKPSIRDRILAEAVKVA